jgi:hypothetical protein
MVDRHAGCLDFPSATPASPAGACGLEDSEIFELARFAARLPGVWLVEWDEDSAGNLSAFLVAGESGESLLLFDRENGRVHLSIVWPDRYEPIAWAGQVRALFAAAERQIAAHGWAALAAG